MKQIPGEIIPLTTMRQAIIKTVSQSNETIPHFYLWNTFIADRMLEEREKSAPDNKISLNAYIIRCVALKLQQYPLMNATLTDAGIMINEDINIGIAVALDGGMVIPVIKNADQKSVIEIDRVIKDMVNRARTKRLFPDDYRGGTFTVSNLGMYGVEGFSAIIQPPQAGILAIGKSKTQWVKTGAAWGEHEIITVTLSVDHRIVDGAPAAQFLAELCRGLEEGEWA